VASFCYLAQVFLLNKVFKNHWLCASNRQSCSNFMLKASVGKLGCGFDLYMVVLKVSKMSREAK